MDMPRAKLSLNQVLAVNLTRLMEEKNLSDMELGRRAEVAPNTIGNYKRGASGDRFTTSGKERSAKLAEIERIAKALEVHPLYLLTDPAEAEEQAKRVAELLLQQAPGAPSPIGTRRRSQI